MKQITQNQLQRTSLRSNNQLDACQISIKLLLQLSLDIEKKNNHTYTQSKKTYIKNSHKRTVANVLPS